MNTYQINQRFQHENRYLGTFCSDNIPKSKRTIYGFICNTQPCSKRGEHWVALYVDDGDAFYFDSFGLPPLSTDLYDYIIKYNLRMSYSNFILQHPSSINCGEYCIAFLEHMYLGKPLSQFFYNFTSDTLLNELFLNIVK